jgi:hypothetical protein
VSASYPGTPSDVQTQGGYQITSTSSPTDAKGAVALGVQPAGSNDATMFASAETTANSDGSVSVNASAGLDALSFGQLFDLANVSSSVSLTQQANGQPTVTSQTNLGTVTLLGKASGLGGTGLSVLGTNVPINLSSEIIGTLNALLASSGIKLTYLPETITYTDGTTSTGSSVDTAKTLESIDSGALRITVIRSLASEGIATVTFTVGRVYVTTSDTPGIAPTTSEGGGVISGAVSSGPTSSAAFGGSDAGSVAVPSVSPSVGGTGSAPPSSSTPQSIGFQPTYALERGPSAVSLYLMLIVVALALLIGSQAVRVFSVRLALSAQPSM